MRNLIFLSIGFINIKILLLLSMENKKNFFILIVNWNGYDDTVECLNSLNNLSAEEFQTIVVDNGSSVDSYLLLKKNFPNIKIFRSETNLGFSGGNNLGIKLALQNKADYILLLNNDTVVEPNFISQLLRVFELDENTGIASPKINYYDSPDIVWSAGGRISKIRGSGFALGNIKSDSISEEIKEVSFVSGCCMLIKKEVFDKVGFLDDDFFLYLEDTDFCIRVRDAGFKIFVANKSVIYHKVSKSTIKLEKPVSLYYTTRNRLLLVRKHFKAYLPVTFIYIALTMSLKSLYWIFVGKRNNGKAVFHAIKDFLRNKKGKIDEKTYGKL